MNRVLVLGCSGSGKTTFTTKLAERIGAKPIFLDQHHWQPGWNVPDRESWHDKVRSLAERDRWVMDGTYDGTLPLRVPRADAVVLLETPRLRCLWNVTYRWLARRPRPELPDGCPDRMSWEFMKYIWTFDQVVRPKILASIERAGNGLTFVRLSSRADADRWLESLPNADDRSRDEAIS